MKYNEDQALAPQGALAQFRMIRALSRYPSPRWPHDCALSKTIVQNEVASLAALPSLEMIPTRKGSAAFRSSCA
ncbi:hypothetical protein C8Q70DRAFT_529795 [Cubamyces menziesii]|nr:hypothetical protein C8Q70DRAFT_529795 [Cubamyces menziesii]